MRRTTTLILSAAFYALPVLAHAGGMVFGAPDRPIPRPPNPNNNPWLNYPLTYGSKAPLHNIGATLKTDTLSNIDRFMSLSATERMAYMQAAQDASFKRGQALFASTRLSSIGLNCMSCHPAGGSAGGKIGVGNHEIDIPSLAGVARRYPRYKPANDRVITQTEMQNNCIVMFMRGEALPASSQEAADLTYYVGQF